MTQAAAGTLTARSADLATPSLVLHVHPMSFTYSGTAEPSSPGGMACVYRELIADSARTEQVAADVHAALERGRHCLVLTQWTAHLTDIDTALRELGHNPVVLRGGMGTRALSAALATLDAAETKLVIATGSFIGEGFDRPALDTLFLAAPIPSRAGSSSTSVAFCVPTPASRPPKCTATTTS